MERPKGRTTPMRVLCLGYFRTGTQSLATALELLGYKPYHFKVQVHDHVGKMHDGGKWAEAFERVLLDAGAQHYEKKDFDELIGNCDAMLEPSFLYRDLLTAYPEAKVIVTTREPKNWLASMRKTLWAVMPWPWHSVVSSDPDYGAPWWHYLSTSMKLICNGDFNDEQLAERRFLEHYEGVREAAGDREVLGFDVKDGWEPLCSFLGAEVPDCPFPRENGGSGFIDLHVEWFRTLAGKSMA
ncbi:hypothetical protein K402DRAFT_328514 [Aulographum hederae CBS 113979]|uniref:P-loop containing nucleoside triphosphate hydrolase protein n=1 Tax=Aulographum hederae CBS 113979 TaxID=1176131 RepID=A0A6G1H6A1_9PEZI|nr:hypothetical protein K402DRAFT_328514 [Aulographum hederae CBS 113979]